MQRAPELFFWRCGYPQSYTAPHPSSSLEVEELFAILKYTKEHCAHYPLPDAIPANGVWGIETLRQWRSPDGDSYFIPLGRMRRGVYHLGLRFDGKSEASVCMGGRTRKSAQFAVVKAQSRPRAVQPANAVHAKNDGNTS